MDKRKGVLRGTWYPDTKEECEEFISSFKKRAQISEKIYGGIVPHAGWYFSGETAAMIIEALSLMKPDLVIVFGMHLPKNSKIRIMTKAGYETPFGDLPVCESLVKSIGDKFDFIAETPHDFQPDNTIEVQLPFIRHFMGEVEVFCCGLPPEKSSYEFGRFIGEKAVELGKNPIVIGSTDLTHYGPSYGYMPYGKAEKAYEKVKNENDKRMINLIEEMDYSGVLLDSEKNMNACCSGAVAGAIGCAEVLGAKKGYCLDYSNSYEKTKSDSFVGYAGICFK
ncbi:MAG: AmmeMemoRadiSam system protein B [Desulforegulaceae bacterium]|nr:AmmeMemoRadiSam system protein B [Desulforegulaceae bacterium]